MRAQLILVSLTALVVIIGLLVLRVDYAITIGLLTGLADLMPYLGTGAVMVPWILYVFFAQGNIVLGIGLSVLYGVIVIARQIMEPKVLASSVGLRPSGYVNRDVRWIEAIRAPGAHCWSCFAHSHRRVLPSKNLS